MSTHDLVEVEHIVSLDTTDIDVERYKELFKDTSIVIVNDNDCVVKATNKAAEIATGDVLIYLSDDFKCPRAWDLAIREKFLNTDTPTLLKVDDCLQKFETAVLTIPIMNRQLYETLGYFWFPEYRSMFVDEDLYWTTEKNKWLVMAPELKFPHEHWCNQLAEMDETYRATEKNWVQGQTLYASRKAANFPLINDMIIKVGINEETIEQEHTESNEVVLSILIPTLPERERYLCEMLMNLNSQIVKNNLVGKVQIITDDRGREITTGQKRNELISQAKGKYIWQVDDDDFIFDYAINEIVNAASKNPDVIVFNGFMTTNGDCKVTFELRLGHGYEAVYREGKEHYLRFPNHIVPMKKELIKDIKFENLSFGEDYKWAKQINDLGLLKTQEIIDKDIYHYIYSTNK